MYAVYNRFDDLSGALPNGLPRTVVPPEVAASILRNKVCLKGTLFTPLSKKNTSTQVSMETWYHCLFADSCCNWTALTAQLLVYAGMAYCTTVLDTQHMCWASTLLPALHHTFCHRGLSLYSPHPRSCLHSIIHSLNLKHQHHMYMPCATVAECAAAQGP